MSKIKIAVLITCHNRRDNSLRCLDALFNSNIPQNVALKIFLVDDASIDGTADAIRQQYKMITILNGDGCQFWTGGMRIAFQKAMQQGFDYYLWLNDDTYLKPDALLSMVTILTNLQESLNMSVIVVGSTFDPETNEMTYGGEIIEGRWIRKGRKVWNIDFPEECDTMNGNIVLIPKDIAHSVGNLDKAFRHSLGDYDYSLRAKKLGYKVYVAPGYIGCCKKNKIDGSYMDEKLPLKSRIKKILHPKGLPPKSWLQFTWRYCGWFWPLYFLWPYCKLILSHTYVRLFRSKNI